MATADHDQLKKPDDLSFEEAVAELEGIIRRIEEGEIGLQESLEQRKRGNLLIKQCRSILDGAEQELEEVSVPESAAGNSMKETH